MERRTLPRSAVDGDVALHALDDAAYQRKPKSQPPVVAGLGRVGLIEVTEDARCQLRLDANAAVADRQLDERPAVRVQGLRGKQADRPSLGRELHRVGDQLV